MSASESKQIREGYYTYGILHISENYRQWEASKGPRYREYRRQWARRTPALDPGEFPLNLNIEVTTRCNLACTFCTQPSLTQEQLGDMPWEMYTRLIDEGQTHQTPAANLNGLGEPMLLKGLPKMIHYAKERGYIDVMFHTNGTLMTESIAQALIESGADRVIFSVDSPDKTTYEAMRIRSNFDRVQANVRHFHHVRELMRRTTPLIRTTMVVTDKTVHQVPDFVERWKPIADQITLQDLTWRTKVLKDSTWRNRENNAIPTDLTQVRAKAIERNISYVCPYLYQSAYAFFNGDVIPCSNPNARKEMVMGNLNQQSMQEVWNGKPYQKLRQYHETGRWHEHPVCRDCEIPLIELYKELAKEGVTFETPGKTASGLPVVASDMAPEQAIVEEDLVMKFQKKETTETQNASSNAEDKE